MANFLDFGAIGKTDWKNPNLDYKNPLWLVAAVGVVLSLILVFVPWISVSASYSGVTAIEGSLSGIGSVYGIFALIGVIVAAYGLLYRQWGFAVVGAGLVVLMVLIFYMAKDGIEFEMVSKVSNDKGDKTLDEFNKFLNEQRHYGLNFTSTVSSLTPIFVLLGSAATAVCSFLLFKKENK